MIRLASAAELMSEGSHTVCHIYVVIMFVDQNVSRFGIKYKVPAEAEDQLQDHLQRRRTLVKVEDPDAQTLSPPITH